MLISFEVGVVVLAVAVVVGAVGYLIDKGGERKGQH